MSEDFSSSAKTPIPTEGQTASGSMLEKMARAISAASAGQVSDEYRAAWADQYWRESLPEARAALEAIRVPSEDFMERHGFSGLALEAYWAFLDAILEGKA